MKIAMFTDTYFPQVSGVATSVKVLVDELEAKGHEVTIFTTTDPDAKIEEEVNIVRIASIPFLFFTDRRVVIGGMNKAYRIAKEKQFDLVHTHTEFGMGLVGKYVAYRLKVPHVHTYHTMYEKYLHYIANGKLVRPSHVKALSHYFCNKASGIIAPGQQMADILKEDYAIEAEIRVIPTGVKIPEKDSTLKSVVRQTLGLTEDDVVLLSLSRLSKEKSLDKLITALPTVIMNYPKTKLIFVGEGPMRSELEQLVQSLQLEKHVQFVGEVANSEVYRYYQMADIYVNASETETQGMTYIEALVNGLPVIAKKNPYLSGIICHSSLGELFDSATQLAETIIQYIPRLKEKQQLSIEEQDKLLYAISAEKFADDVLSFYQDVQKDNAIHRRVSDNPKVSILSRTFFKDWDDLK